jgi:ABC-2 type transport system permease protein
VAAGRRLLALLFRPSTDIRPLELAVFFVAIWGAYLIRTMFMWVLGLLTFWTTRVSAIFEAWFTAELLLSGRLVPMSLMPDWVRTLASFTPFPSSFGFPIESLVGDCPPASCCAGSRSRPAGSRWVPAWWR